MRSSPTLIVCYYYDFGGYSYDFGFLLEFLLKIKYAYFLLNMNGGLEDMVKQFPVIDPIATGENIMRLRKAKGLSVRDLQSWFGFEEPQAIYKWQKGKSLPTVDNLYALGALLDVPME